MGFRKWFGRRDSDPEDFCEELTLDAMRVGFLVDYDLKTWEVIGYNTYDYDGFETQEWVLRCGEEVRFLEREEDDGQVEWSLTRRIRIARIQEPVVDRIRAGEDPPEVIHFEGRRYEAVECSAGLFYEGGGGEGREFVEWNYESGEERLLSISQWGENDFSAYEGEYVEEYQFTDILPGAEERNL